MEETKKEVKKEETPRVENKEQEKEVKKEETPKVENKVQEKKTEVKKVEENKKTENIEKVQKTEKKQDSKKGEKETKKKNKSALWIIIAVLIIAIIAVMAGVILFSSSPKENLNDVLTALKTGDYKNAENYKELISSSGILEDDGFNQEAQKLFFDKLEWNIKDEKIEGDKATIELEITNKDFKTIIKNYMQKAIKIAFAGQEVSEEQMTNYLLDELRNEEIELVTVNQTVTMNKKDGKWEVEDAETLVYALLPGLSEAMDSIM